jgi:hypothetical protein
MVPCGESGAVVFGGQLDVEPFTGGLERMGCTKTHGHPQSRKPVARDRLILEVMPPATRSFDCRGSATCPLVTPKPIRFAKEVIDIEFR